MEGGEYEMNAGPSNKRASVIYDGECQFCIARIADIRKFDSDQRLEYLPWQDEDTQKRFPQISGRNLDDGMLLIEPDGSIHVAADAMYHIGMRLPKWRRIAPLYNVPGLKQLGRLGYSIVAANRRRLGQICTNGVCKLDHGHKSAEQLSNSTVARTKAEGDEMEDSVSESKTGQKEPKPDREERDAAFSSGAGRKAVEEPVEQQEFENRRKSRMETEAPVGLDLETKAVEEDHHDRH
jgi:predicted DCC family thiol-disulfide oxidoreductase YuxK